MSANISGRNNSTITDREDLLPDVQFSGDDTILLDVADDETDQELIMGNLVINNGAAARRVDNVLNDSSDSALLMSEVENGGVEEERRRNSYTMVVDDTSDDHCHGPPPVEDVKARNQLIIVSVCCFLFMVAEIIGGFISHSLAIGIDATHMACDLAGFLVSLFSIWISKKPPSKRLSFGYFRAEVVGALCSILLIWLLTVILIIIAIIQIKDKNYGPEPVPMLITASLGLLFNIAMGVVLHSGIFDVCNIRSAFGHGHSHGGGGHGHSHGGGGHGHSHGGGGHGHSHGGGGHGHSHDGGHGHSHEGRGHGYLHDGQIQDSQTHLQNHQHSHHHNHDHHHNDVSSNCISRTVVASSEDVSDYAFSQNSRHSVLMTDFAGHGSDSEALVIPDGVASSSEDCNSVIVEGEKKKSSFLSFLNVSDNLNVRAAFVHVLGDFIQSVGVFITAVIVMVKPELGIADPICTFVFSFLVLCTTINVLRDVLLIVMEGVPRDIDYMKVKQSLFSIQGVMSVHSLNIWSITQDKAALNVHLAVSNPSTDWERVLKASNHLLRTKFNIYHPTIQVERYDDLNMKHCSRCKLP